MPMLKLRTVPIINKNNQEFVLDDLNKKKTDSFINFYKVFYGILRLLLDYTFSYRIIIRKTLS